MLRRDCAGLVKRFYISLDKITLYVKVPLAVIFHPARGGTWMRKFSAPGTLFEAILEKNRDRSSKDAVNSASSVSDGVDNKPESGRRVIKLRRDTFFVALAGVAVLLVTAFVLGRITASRPAQNAPLAAVAARETDGKELPPLALAPAVADDGGAEKNITVQACCYAAAGRKTADEAVEFLKSKFDVVFVRESGKYVVVYVGRFARKSDAAAQETLRAVRNLKYRNIRAFKDADFYVLGK
jgi:hydrogenase maturation factor